MPYLAFAAVLVLWVAFGIVLAMNPERLETTWAWARDQSLLVQGLLWILLLPWMASLAIWESAWALPVRLTIVAAIAFTTVYLFIPRPA